MREGTGLFEYSCSDPVPDLFDRFNKYNRSLVFPVVCAVQKRDTAALVMRLASDAARQVTGQIVMVDAGYTST